MRIPICVAVLACLAVYPSPAHAEGLVLGTIVVTDGGTGSNRCTATPFVIGANTRFTVQCDQAASIASGATGCDAGTCLTITAGEKFPTSVGAAQSLTCNGSTTHYGGWLAVAPVSGATLTCKVAPRLGTE